MKILLLIIPLLLQALTFKVASYNVENLFDMQYSGKEYSEYVPNSSKGWDRYTYQKKLSNISKVLYDINADIIGLVEIESKKALLDLRKAVKRRGLEYRYFAIADKKQSTVKTAILSKYKIIKTRYIRVAHSDSYRDILEVHILVDSKELIVFVNHWKSKSAPESERIKYARSLKKRLLEIPKNQPYIILGDFNSNYNENITFINDRRLNNTYGKTGIDNILKTIVNGKFVTSDMIKKRCDVLYNLWLELPYEDRFSYLYHGRKNTIDNMILPCSMFDKRGIDYIDHSFNVFKAPYLFRNGSINRWVKRRGYGKFTGEGYSDHLPIYAFFTTDGTSDVVFKRVIKKQNFKIVPISYLYNVQYLTKPVKIKDAVVIAKYRSAAVLKQKGERAIYVFRLNDIFKKGYLYDLVVKKISRYKGNLEIDSIINATRNKRVKDMKDYYLHYKKGMDLSKKIYQNEVLYKIDGVYRDGFLYYAPGKRIKVFNRVKKLYLKNNTFLRLKRVRIAGYKNHNEIVIEFKKEVAK